MKTITLGLALSLQACCLYGGAAMAQTAPQPAQLTPPPLKQPAAGPATQPMPPMPQPGGMPGQTGAAPSGPPEGMVIETPNGLYLVRPGDPNPRPLAMGRPATGPQGMDPQGMGQHGPAAMTEGDDAMGDMAEDGIQPPPHHPHMGMPPRPPEGKGARFRIKTPNLTLGMKCPDDEPIKACVDAVSQLLDKAGQPH